MNLYIEIKDGSPINHPAFEDNLTQAFDSIPAHWQPFTRVERPLPGVYQVVPETAIYQKVNNVWADVWAVRDMTAEEKTAKQQAAKADWASLPDRDNFSAWVFDEATCAYQPPIPRPETGNYFWQGTTSSWVERPPYPTDGGQYKLNFSTATWVAIT
jgi:hypothetical protein